MPSRRNAIYILIVMSLITGVFTGRAFFFNLAYMLFGILIISWIWVWTAIRWIGLTRRTRTRRAQVGQIFEESFAFRNRSFLPKLWLEIIDQSTLPGHRASHIVPSVTIGGQYSWQVRTRCTVRGEFRLGPMLVSSGDPFGLFTLTRTIPATSRMIVYPRMIQLNKLELPMGMLSGGESQRRRTHYVTTNAAGVRDYAPGDSFNRIHWRTSARKERLVVKEFELDPLVDIWLIADFSAESLVEDSNIIKRVNGDGPVIASSSDIPPSTEEYVTVVAASLARYFIQMERVIGFAAYIPNREVYQPERSNRQLTRILEALAVARSTSTYTLGQMLTLETPHMTRGTTLIIVTSSQNPDWVRRAQILTRRGIKPMCIYIEGDSFASAPPADEIISRLRSAKIPVLRLRNGNDINAILQQRPL
ncbi:MAG: DUF58 domain-containing protein [Anaerolineaceae bacterium]|nr:MAG: DUF58 domain-containing protein [Anaerolineaceae bacterium]